MMAPGCTPPFMLPTTRNRASPCVIANSTTSVASQAQRLSQNEGPMPAHASIVEAKTNTKMPLVCLIPVPPYPDGAISKSHRVNLHYFILVLGHNDRETAISESGPHGSRLVGCVSVRTVTISSVASLF